MLSNACRTGSWLIGKEGVLFICAWEVCFPQTAPMEMGQFLHNLYFSQVAGKITYLFKVTVGLIYSLEYATWCSIMVVGFMGMGVSSGFRGNGICGSPCVN